MCFNVEMMVRVRGDGGPGGLALPKPSGIPLDDGSGAKLRLWGEFPLYYVTNGCCGCGAIDGPRDGPGRLVVVRFVEDLLAVFPVDSVELLWWRGDDSDRPGDLPRRPIDWPAFVDLNDRGELESRVLYLIQGKPERKRRTRRSDRADRVAAGW